MTRLFPVACCPHADLRRSERADLRAAARAEAYETEARNSAFKNHPVTSKTCVASADYDAFRDETMAQYQKADNVKKDCALCDIKTLKSGFAFAMACSGTKTVLTYEFGKDEAGKELVRGTIQTLIKAAPKYSSSILIMMKRVGDCPGQTPTKPL